MGLLEDVMEKSVPGLVVGALATAVILPIMGGAGAVGAGRVDGRARRGIGRSLMKAAVTGYVMVADGVKEVAAETREQLGDLAAEVREERRARAEADQAQATADSVADGEPSPASGTT